MNIPAVTAESSHVSQPPGLEATHWPGGWTRVLPANTIETSRCTERGAAGANSTAQDFFLAPSAVPFSGASGVFIEENSVWLKEAARYPGQKSRAWCWLARAAGFTQAGSSSRRQRDVWGQAVSASQKFIFEAPHPSRSTHISNFTGNRITNLLASSVMGNLFLQQRSRTSDALCEQDITSLHWFPCASENPSWAQGLKPRVAGPWFETCHGNEPGNLKAKRGWL